MKHALLIFFFCAFVQFSAAAEQLRIVSLAPNLTEILFALGAGKSVVGVTEQCDFPPEVTQKPKIGTYVNPSLETLLSLRPDIVLATEGNPRRFLNSLKGQKIRVVEIPTESLEDVSTSFRTIGELIQKKEEGVRISQTFNQSIQKLEALQPKWNKRPRSERTFLAALQFQPLYSVSDNTFLGSLFRRAGLTNMVRETRVRYPILSPEEVIRIHPRWLFAFRNNPSRGGPTRSDGETEKLTADLKRLGFKREEVTFLPPDFFLRPGPRLSEGISYLVDTVFHSIL